MKSKRLFFIITGVYTLISGYGFAQQAKLRNEPINIGAAKMLSNNNLTGNKKTALQSRLTGAAYCLHNGAFYEPTDSTSYKYSGLRGGDLNSEKLKFDNGQDWTYTPGTASYNVNMRYAQTFDMNNNILTTVYEKWDAPSSSWINDHKYLYTYDISNNLVNYIYQAWSSSAIKWINQWQYLYTYDSKGNMLEQVYRTWLTSSESWRNENKYTFTYNNNNDYLSKLYQDWSSSSGAWINQDQELYTYDSAGNLSTDINQYWSTSGSGSWRNTDKTSYAYNSNNNPVSMLYQTWSTFSSSWYNNEQHLYTYDTIAVNNLVLEHKHTWGGSAWNNNEQIMYTYDAAGNRLTEQRQTWVGWPTNNWRNSFFHTSAYDSRKNQLSHIEQVWSTSANAWINNRMYDFAYNNYNQLTSTKSNTWNSGGFWYPTTTDYNNRYYYEEYGSTGIAKADAQNSLKLYPVPANGTLNINLDQSTSQKATMAIYSIEGRVMAQWQTDNTNNYHKALDVSQMAAGMYILKVYGDNSESYQHFTIVH